MNIDFNKSEGLVPVIIQDEQTLEVLMLGYMNSEAFEKTEKEGKVTFFSRTKNRLWTKGEESGHFLNVKSISLDCDQDTLLIKVNPVGPTCHKGTRSCFDTSYNQNFIFQFSNFSNVYIYTGFNHNTRFNQLILSLNFILVIRPNINFNKIKVILLQ